MKKFVFAIAAIILLAGCTKKDDPVDGSITDNLCAALSWYAKSGLTYTYEEFISVAGAQISVGMKTRDLIYDFKFRKDGTGTNHVYYQKDPLTIGGARPNADYANLTMKWNYSGGVLTIDFSEKDNIIPSQLKINVDYCWNESFQGTLNGSKFKMYTDRSYVEK